MVDRNAALWLDRSRMEFHDHGRCRQEVFASGRPAAPRIVKLYRSLKFTLKFVNAPRRISCTGDWTPAPKVLAFRNLE